MPQQNRTHLAIICSIEIPTFIMPLGAIDRKMNSAANMTSSATGRPMDDAIEAPFAAVGPGEQCTTCDGTHTTQLSAQSGDVVSTTPKKTANT